MVTMTTGVSLPLSQHLNLNTGTVLAFVDSKCVGAETSSFVCIGALIFRIFSLLEVCLKRSVIAVTVSELSCLFLY